MNSEEFLLDENDKLQKALDVATAFLYEHMGIIIKREFTDDKRIEEIDLCKETLEEITEILKDNPHETAKNYS